MEEKWQRKIEHVQFVENCILFVHVAMKIEINHYGILHFVVKIAKIFKGKEKSEKESPCSIIDKIQLLFALRMGSRGIFFKKFKITFQHSDSRKKIT